MTTKMEKVAQDLVLAAARMAGSAPHRVLDQQAFMSAFQEAWPIPGSSRPMNDAINTGAQAASNCTGQDTDSWQNILKQCWHPAATEVVNEYFSNARRSFRKGAPQQGSQILTDAVRATLGSIAASRNWPHSTEEDLFSTAAALGSGTGLARLGRGLRQRPGRQVGGRTPAGLRPRRQHRPAREHRLRIVRGSPGASG